MFSGSPKINWKDCKFWHGFVIWVILNIALGLIFPLLDDWRIVERNVISIPIAMYITFLIESRWLWLSGGNKTKCLKTKCFETIKLVTFVASGITTYIIFTAFFEALLPPIWLWILAIAILLVYIYVLLKLQWKLYALKESLRSSKCIIS